MTELLESFLLTNSVLLLRLESTGELPDQLVSASPPSTPSPRPARILLPCVWSRVLYR